MNVTCIENFNYKHITVGKDYRVSRVCKSGLVIRNDNKEPVFYPNRCFGLVRGDYKCNTHIQE